MNMPIKRPSDEWITVRQAAVRLRRTYGQTLRLMEIGELEAKRQDGHWYIRLQSVEPLQRILHGERTD